MANKGIKNLTPFDSERAKRAGNVGGVKSGEARRQKKLLSEIYGEVIADLYKIDAKKGTPAKTIIKAILERTDSASVSMLKELREATEGNRLEVTGQQIVYLDKQDQDL